MRIVIVLAIIFSGCARAVAATSTGEHSELETPISSVKPEATPEPTSFEAPFCSHITVPAKVLSPGRFAYRTAPGDDVANSKFLNNTLSVGVFPRIEVGTIPYEWTRRFQMFNALVKTEVYRSSEVHFGFGLAYGHWGIDSADLALPPDVNFNLDIQVYQLGLALNWVPVASRWSYGFNLNSYMVDAEINHHRKTVFKPTPNYYGDLSYRMSDKVYVTGGLSYANLSNMSSPSYQDVLGAGLSFSHTFRNWYVSVLSAGVHHYPDNGLTKLLWSVAL